MLALADSLDKFLSNEGQQRTLGARSANESEVLTSFIGPTGECIEKAKEQLVSLRQAIPARFVEERRLAVKDVVDRNTKGSLVYTAAHLNVATTREILQYLPKLDAICLIDPWYDPELGRFDGYDTPKTVSELVKKIRSVLKSCGGKIISWSGPAEKLDAVTLGVGQPLELNVKFKGIGRIIPIYIYAEDATVFPLRRFDDKRGAAACVIKVPGHHGNISEVKDAKASTAEFRDELDTVARFYSRNIWNTRTGGYVFVVEATLPTVLLRPELIGLRDLGAEYKIDNYGAVAYNKKGKQQNWAVFRKEKDLAQERVRELIALDRAILRILRPDLLVILGTDEIRLERTVEYQTAESIFLSLPKTLRRQIVRDLAQHADSMEALSGKHYLNQIVQNFRAKQSRSAAARFTEQEIKFSAKELELRKTLDALTAKERRKLLDRLTPRERILINRRFLQKPPDSLSVIGASLDEEISIQGTREAIDRAIERANLLLISLDKPNSIEAFLAELPASSVVSSQVRNTVQAMGIKSITSFKNVTEAQLLAKPNFGPESLIVVKQVLARKGISLKGQKIGLDPDSIRILEETLPKDGVVTRIIHVAEKLGVRSLEGFSNVTEAKLLEQPGFGLKSLKPLKRVLRKRGIQIGSEVITSARFSENTQSIDAPLYETSNTKELIDWVKVAVSPNGAAKGVIWIFVEQNGITPNITPKRKLAAMKDRGNPDVNRWRSASRDSKPKSTESKRRGKTIPTSKLEKLLEPGLRKAGSAERYEVSLKNPTEMVLVAYPRKSSRFTEATKLKDIKNTDDAIDTFISETRCRYETTPGIKVFLKSSTLRNLDAEIIEATFSTLIIRVYKGDDKETFMDLSIEHDGSINYYNIIAILGQEETLFDMGSSSSRLEVTAEKALERAKTLKLDAWEQELSQTRFTEAWEEEALSEKRAVNEILWLVDEMETSPWIVMDDLCFGPDLKGVLLQYKPLPGRVLLSEQDGKDIGSIRGMMLRQLRKQLGKGPFYVESGKDYGHANEIWVYGSMPERPSVSMRSSDTLPHRTRRKTRTRRRDDHIGRKDPRRIFPSQRPVRQQRRPARFSETNQDDGKKQKKKALKALLAGIDRLNREEWAHRPSWDRQPRSVNLINISLAGKADLASLIEVVRELGLDVEGNYIYDIGRTYEVTEAIREAIKKLNEPDIDPKNPTVETVRFVIKQSGDILPVGGDCPFFEGDAERQREEFLKWDGLTPYFEDEDRPETLQYFWIDATQTLARREDIESEEEEVIEQPGEERRGKRWRRSGSADGRKGETAKQLGDERGHAQGGSRGRRGSRKARFSEGEVLRIRHDHTLDFKIERLKELRLASDRAQRKILSEVRRICSRPFTEVVPFTVRDNTLEATWIIERDNPDQVDFWITSPDLKPDSPLIILSGVGDLVSKGKSRFSEEPLENAKVEEVIEWTKEQISKAEGSRIFVFVGEEQYLIPGYPNMTPEEVETGIRSHSSRIMREKGCADSWNAKVSKGFKIIRIIIEPARFTETQTTQEATLELDFTDFERYLATNLPLEADQYAGMHTQAAKNAHKTTANFVSVLTNEEQAFVFDDTITLKTKSLNINQEKVHPGVTTLQTVTSLLEVYSQTPSFTTRPLCIFLLIEPKDEIRITRQLQKLAQDYKQTLPNLYFVLGKKLNNDDQRPIKISYSQAINEFIEILKDTQVLPGIAEIISVISPRFDYPTQLWDRIQDALEVYIQQLKKQQETRIGV